MVWGSGRDGNAKEYYTIETILFFLDNVEMPHPQYIKAAIEKFGATEKFGTHYSVSRPDRKGKIRNFGTNSCEKSCLKT